MHKKLLSALLALCLCAALLCPAYAAQSQSAAVVSQALRQTGYTEHSDEWTQFGQWYGIPHGYWCDYCSFPGAQTAPVCPMRSSPPPSSCTAHVKAFTKKGRYAASIARGGTYLPRQGDLIFFYDPVCNPTGSRQVHVGLVLYTENGRVFTVEGNSLSKRTDLPYQTVHDNAADDQDPLDYVTVNSYALDAPQIHGYAIPAYTGRDALSLSGFVDLGKYSNLRSQVETLCAENIMAPTSSHTFSPNHGMTRGEFLADVMALFGLSGWRDDTPAFSDVSANSPWYDAVMTARCAGIVRGSGSNTFSPTCIFPPTRRRRSCRQRCAMRAWRIRPSPSPPATRAMYTAPIPAVPTSPKPFMPCAAALPFYPIPSPSPSCWGSRPPGGRPCRSTAAPMYLWLPYSNTNRPSL